MSETLTTIQIRRGIKAQLPSVAEVGELLLTTDTHELFVGTGSGVVPITVGGTPGGGDTQVQYNDAGSFDGDPAFTYADETQQLQFGASMPGALAQFQVGGVGAAFVGVGGTTSTCGIDCGEDRADQVLVANAESPSNGVKIVNTGADGSGAIEIGWSTAGITDPPYTHTITMDASGISASTPDTLSLFSSGVGSLAFVIGGDGGAMGLDLNSSQHNAVVVANAELQSEGILIQDLNGGHIDGSGTGKVLIGLNGGLNAPRKFLDFDPAVGITLEDDDVLGSAFVIAEHTGLGNSDGVGFAGTTGACFIGGNGTTPANLTLGEAPDRLAFFGAATPIVKPTVTGSRGGNAALASLLTALAALGLITNGTSA